jgi:hypothetical protein
MKPNGAPIAHRPPGAHRAERHRREHDERLDRVLELECQRQEDRATDVISTTDNFRIRLSASLPRRRSRSCSPAGATPRSESSAGRAAAITSEDSTPRPASPTP